MKKVIYCLGLGIVFMAAIVACDPAQSKSKALIPNLEGKVLTVNGPVNPSELGETLMHEHIFIKIQEATFDVAYIGRQHRH